MESFPEWQQNKIYSDHIQRLRHINHRSASNKLTKSSRKKFHSTKNITSVQKFHNDSQYPQKKLSRYETEPVLKNKAQFRAPIPLVSYKQGKLIKSALSSRNISLKEKQTLLQNYLLSKRIMETKPVINPVEFKRQFKLHKKASQNLSKSKRRPLVSQDRVLNYKIYEKQKQLLDQVEVGQGRNHFDFKIKQILLIKGIVVKTPHVLYNLKIFIGKNHYELRALEYDTLFDNYIRINFKRSILVNNPQITILLSMLRQNHEQQIGTFKPIINSFENKSSEIYKIMKGRFPVGTIDIEGKITYFINRQKTQIDQYH